jgi:hypothetical protein
MVYFKIVNGKYKNKKSIYYTIRYVLKPEKNPHNVFHARGNTHEDIKKISNSFYTVQEYYRKTGCKRILHFILAFSPEEKHTPSEYLNYGYQIINFFGNGYQFVFALHESGNNGEKKYPHIHILLNPINAKTGERLYIDKSMLYSLHQYINSIFKNQTDFKSFPENDVL